ncbi:MAG TPA: CocE/NonD family hydrolase [Nitriliruptorales bacterium]
MLHRLVLGVTVIALLALAWPATAQSADIHIDRNLEIPVSSGNVLRGDLYRPVIDGQPATGLPTVVTYFPYNKDDPTRFEIDGMNRFAAAGYAALLVDIAGTGVSPGEFGFLSAREARDGHDVVEWAAAQPFSNGRVGMWGYSYPGLMAAHVAATQPPHLRAVVPASIFHDAYRDVVFPGGILTSQDGAGLLPYIASMSVVRARPNTDPVLGLEAALDSITTPGGLATLAEAPTHTTYDDYWQERALENKVGNITVPTLLWGGWADIYQRATPLLYEDIGAEHVGLVMGPWGHLAGASGAQLEFQLDETLRWFETFLRADPTPEQAAAATGVRVFDVDWYGDDLLFDAWPGQMVELPSWPPESTETTLALCAGGGAAPSVEAPWPVQGGLVDSCDAEGSLPVPNVVVDANGGGSIGHDAVANLFLNELWDDKDQRLSLQSAAWITEPFAQDVVLSGFMTARLWASTVGTNADWVVRVVDIGPDRTRVISPGWLRASRRAEDPGRPYLWHPHDGDEPVVPGEAYEMSIEIWPNSYRLPVGHRLGLLVRTADTLKVTPGIGSLASSVLTGPERPSSLTFSARAAGIATPVPVPTPDDGDAAGTGQSTTPATGGGLALAAVAMLVGAVARRRS